MHSPRALSDSALDRIEADLHRYTYRPTSNDRLHWVDLRSVSPGDVVRLIEEIRRLRGLLPTQGVLL